MTANDDLTRRAEMAAVDKLSATITGVCHRSHDPDHDQARTVFPGFVDRRPAYIAADFATL